MTTEVPNLVLSPAAATKPTKPRRNKGAAKKNMKKPAAAKTSMKKQRKKQKVVFVHMYKDILTYFLTLYVRLFI